MDTQSQQSQSEPILRGRLQDLDIGSLLSALRLGRQYLTLEVYDAAGDCTGVVAVKAGRILSASVEGCTGTEAVRRLLQSRDAAEFRVIPQPLAADSELQPLGTIESITQAIAANAQPPHAHLLQGKLSERLSFDDVLRSVSFTRQHITLTLSDDDGRTLGEIAVKANKVLSARADDLLGLPAIRQLQRAPLGSNFALFHETQSVMQLHPLGKVAEVLSSARKPSSNGHGHEKKSTWSTQAAEARRQGRILEGSLEELELANVLKVLSTSRQHFELHVRDESSAMLGVIEVKAGMVLAAGTLRLTGVAAAYELLRVQEGRFVAIRRAEEEIDQPALLSVSELLQPRAAALPAPSENANDPIVVMSGKLGELDVPSILSVAGASRQYTGVHIIDDEGKPTGIVHLKSGQVVRAQAQELTGVLAVRRLLHCPRDFSFLVQRYPHASEAMSSIGSIGDILAQAAAQPVTAAAAPPDRPLRREASSSTWMGGAILGAGFVLLGGIATALVLPSPTRHSTSISPITVAPKRLAPEAAEVVPPPPVLQQREPAPSEAPPPESSATLSRATIASLQAGLRQLGYDTGEADGVLGPRTAAAIKAFQYVEHLTVDGTLSAPTRAVLSRRINDP